MADSEQTSVLHQVQDLPEYENARKAIDKTSRSSADSIARLENIISEQKDRLKQMQQQSAGTSSQLRLQASMKDVLLMSKQTLAQLRQSAKCLELSSATLDT